MRLGRFQEAASLLMAEEAGLTKLTSPRPQDRAVAIGRPINLYERWNKPAEAATWRAVQKP